MDREEERAAERREGAAAEEPCQPIHEGAVQRVQEHGREMEPERVPPPQTLIEPERRERERSEDAGKAAQVCGLDERVECRAIEAHA